MYTYAQVENALREVLGVDANRLGALRGRIKHLQRLGLVPAAPGKGKRVQYTMVNAYDWLMAMLISEHGLEQATVVPLIKSRELDRYWLEVGKSSNDTCFIFSVEKLSRWDKIPHDEIFGNACLIINKGEIGGSIIDKFEGKCVIIEIGKFFTILNKSLDTHEGRDVNS